MKKELSLVLLLLLIILPANAQQDTKPQEAKPAAQEAPQSNADQDLDQRLYHEIVIEDFENIEFTEKDIVFQKSRFEEYKVGIRTDYPAEVNNSKKYLGVKMKGLKSNAIQIKFPKKLVIDKYCREISVWVYGKKFSGELSVFIMDANGDTHRLVLGTLDFHGWRKLTRKLPRELAQSDQFLEEKKSIQILSLLYVPGSGYQPGTNITDAKWQTFYIDDITAMVRAKYTDLQNDDW